MLSRKSVLIVVVFKEWPDEPIKWLFYFELIHLLPQQKKKKKYGFSKSFITLEFLRNGV